MVEPQLTLVGPVLPLVEQQNGSGGTTDSGVVDQRVSMASLSGGLDGSYSVSAAFSSKLVKEK